VNPEATCVAPQQGEQETAAVAQTNVVDHEGVRRAHGFHDLSVKRVVQETHDTRSYVLDVPAGLREAFGYEPGQFCTFRARVGAGEHLRSYSMSSTPGIDQDLVVTVKRVAGGVVSNWFHDHVVEGSVLEVTRPAGVFCPGSRDAPLVAFCGGSGITPVVSIMKSVLRRTRRPVKLFYANRDRNSVIFERSFEELRAQYVDRLEIQQHFDSDTGYVGSEAVVRFAERALDADFYICGPGPFMDLVEANLLELGVKAERILIERFETGTTGPSGRDSLEELEELEEPLNDSVEAASEDPEPDDSTPRAVTLILKGTSKTVPYRAGDTVLETARRGGLQPPFSCEAGNCATCMALLREGGARMRANNALTPEEVEEGWVLTCQALPLGSSVTVEYEAL
jgi:3-ketosteroid 9alpha-monooxygenase subunit B